MKTFILYIFYLLFTKQLPKTLLLSLILLVATFLIEQYKEHANNDDDVTDIKTNKTLLNTQIALVGSSLIITFAGFILGYRQSIAKSSLKSKSFLKYIIGSTQCT